VASIPLFLEEQEPLHTVPQGVPQILGLLCDGLGLAGERRQAVSKIPQTGERDALKGSVTVGAVGHTDLLLNSDALSLP
jgi:hypothetical protein